MLRRVLSMWEPWGILTVAPDPAHETWRPPKGIETRHFRPKLDLPIQVVIHATKRWSGAATALCQREPFRNALTRCGYYAGDPRRAPHDMRAIPLGALIGLATIVSVIPSESLVLNLGAEDYQDEYALGNYNEGRFGWVLANTLVFDAPIPFSGRQDVLYPLPMEYCEQIAAYERRLAGVAA